MKTTRQEPELIAVRRLGEDFAKQRKERLTTAHLLAAIASRPGAAAELLAERALSAERLLRAARASVDDGADPIRRAVQHAREVAARMGAREPLGVHLLLALLSDRGCAGHRALDQCGVDVSRLRVAAMNVGLGLVGRRRIVTRRDGATEAAAQPPAGRRQNTAVTVPLLPSRPPPRRSGASTQPPPPEDTGPTSGSTSSGRGGASPPPSTPSPPAPAVGARAKSSTPSRFALDPRKFPVLCTMGRNLTLEAEQGALDPVVGREREVEQALDVLAKRQANNPCLVGPAGVGKTSVARALALRIAESREVATLDDRIVIEVPVGELVAGTGVRGALAQRLGALRKELLRARGRVVLFFDEIHQLFAGDVADEILGELKTALARGELPCLGATTIDEFRRFIDGDPALGRRFTVVEVDEPTREEAYLIVDSLSEPLARHHGVAYTEEALALSVGWSVRYLPARALPDKAIAILDLAGARARRRGAAQVSPETVAEVVAEMAGVPVERLLETDGERMLRLEELLAERVVGHGEQLRHIARILRRNAAGLGSHRPLGTFLLLGPTGVGKTETAKALAEVLFFSESAMTRIDLSEFGEAHAAARLIGAPPGYVGHEAGGQLTEAVRRRPYQVVLLDELEKAHPEVLETFLAVFDEGRLTDGRGRTVDFGNTVILLTSNIGAAEIEAAARRRVGFTAGSSSRKQDLSRAFIDQARSALAPELYNRIDEVLVFAPLEREEVREIARRLLTSLRITLETERGIRLEHTESVIDVLLDSGGFEPALGARPMKRTIARLVEAPLAEKILGGEARAGDVVSLSSLDGRLQMGVISGAASSAAE